MKMLQAGAVRSGMPMLQAAAASRPAAPRDVFVFFISGAKERAPAAAMALMQRLR